VDFPHVEIDEGVFGLKALSTLESRLGGLKLALGQGFEAALEDLLEGGGRLRRTLPEQEPKR
jgi:hypothetical protein